VGWLALMVVPLLIAYLSTLRGAGRSLASGLSTALSSSALVLVAVHPDLPSFLREFQSVWGWAFMIMYGHTTCTLFAVKSMIRERSSNRFLGASIGWHVAWVLATAVGTLHGLPRIWPVFFMVAAVLAAGLPVYARRRPLSPMTIGIVELALTLFMLGLMMQPGL
jgi:predicted branched-subunit amino acid permease